MIEIVLNCPSTNAALLVLLIGVQAILGRPSYDNPHYSLATLLYICRCLPIYRLKIAVVAAYIYCYKIVNRTYKYCYWFIMQEESDQCCQHSIIKPACVPISIISLFIFMIVFFPLLNEDSLESSSTRYERTGFCSDECKWALAKQSKSFWVII